MFWVKLGVFFNYVRDNVLICGAAYIAWHFVSKYW